MSREVVVVPHTHWDREWYEPFQTFRLRLVDLLDDLLPRLDADPAYRHFLLDGQMAVVDDYLEVRPEAEPVLRRLAASGRLSMGPWYILMDEFLVSGETMIRDLQMGLERAAAFGGAMPVGYLPDMFGHIAQMPQILQQFGFDHAVVWRGVPEAMQTSAFWWESPDGSTVRTQYLPEGYSNGASLPDDAKELVGMVRRFETTYGSLAGVGADAGPLLWMNGTDHQMPRPWLGRVVAEANDIQDDYELRVASLAEYLTAAAAHQLRSGHEIDRVTGELRSGARANLLMGVASNRTDVRQASIIAERAVERLAEPLSALWLTADRWPAALLAEAWRQIVLNSAHDSVCACSVDEVADAVLHRYAEARQIGDGLTDRAVASLAGTVGGDRPLVVNASSRSRDGLVELTVPGEGPIPGTQILRQFAGERVIDGLTRSEATPIVLGAIDGWDDIVDGRVEVGADGVTVVRLDRDPTRRHGKWNGPVRGPLLALATDDPDAPARFVFTRPAGRRVLVRVDEVPGFGWRRLAEIDTDGTAAAPPPVVVDGLMLDNGLVRVAIDPTDGTFAIDGRSGFGQLVDDGDEGDTYNYCEPAGDVIVDRPVAVTTEVIEDGPLRARIRIEATYQWPERVVDHQRVGQRDVVVATTIEVQAGERLVRVSHELDNSCRDHRLRVWFPLPEPATESHAECAFAVVTRGIGAEGGPNEPALPTYPSRRFVQAGGLTVVHEGLTEYELVGVTTTTASSLALTLLRCNGMLSQAPMTSRPLPAGPIVAVEGPQMAGVQTMRYGLQIGDTDPYALVDAAFLPLIVADPPSPGSPGSSPGGSPGRADTGSALTVHGAEVSSVTRSGGQVQVRVWNPSDAPTTVTIEGATGWLVDLRGIAVAPFEGSFELGSWRIATAVLT
jgi:mannosylglycerate hydrolase